MRLATLPARIGMTLAVAGTGVALASGAAVAAHPEHPQPFFVVADGCWMGYAEGLLSWRAVHPPEPAVVDVTGTVYDRFRYEGSGCVFPCAPEVCDDGLSTTAFFTAFAGGVEVDRERRSADNGAADFRFTLGDDVSQTVPEIDRVVIQVCRFSATGSSTRPVYCGKPQTFRPAP